ncbi:hypothetical protein SAMN05216299_11277 [Nitrosospira sp. Nsp14]|nr:hypothetical protein SAMN05216299_11277 [Nitrosospira sp. Nsp14]
MRLGIQCALESRTAVLYCRSRNSIPDTSRISSARTNPQRASSVREFFKLPRIGEIQVTGPVRFTGVLMTIPPAFYGRRGHIAQTGRMRRLCLFDLFAASVSVHRELNLWRGGAVAYPAECSLGVAISSMRGKTLTHQGAVSIAETRPPAGSRAPRCRDPWHRIAW